MNAGVSLMMMETATKRQSLEERLLENNFKRQGEHLITVQKFVNNKEGFLQEIFTYQSSLHENQTVLVYENRDARCLRGDHVESIIQHFGFTKQHEIISQGSLYQSGDVKIFIGNLL